MGSCQADDTLTVPVTLSEGSGRGVQIIDCSVVAAGTLLDLQTAITTVLGSHDVFNSLSYRGSKTLLTSPLESFSSGGCDAPRFQASYQKAISFEVKLATGQQLTHLFRCTSCTTTS